MAHWAAAEQIVRGRQRSSRCALALVLALCPLVGQVHCPMVLGLRPLVGQVHRPLVLGLCPLVGQVQCPLVLGLCQKLWWVKCIALKALSLCLACAGFMFTGAALVSGAGDGKVGMLEGLIIEKLNGWDIEKRYETCGQVLVWYCWMCSR